MGEQVERTFDYCALVAINIVANVEKMIYLIPTF